MFDKTAGQEPAYWILFKARKELMEVGFIQLHALCLPLSFYNNIAWVYIYKA